MIIGTRRQRNANGFDAMQVIELTHYCLPRPPHFSHFLSETVFRLPTQLITLILASLEKRGFGRRVQYFYIFKPRLSFSAQQCESPMGYIWVLHSAEKDMVHTTVEETDKNAGSRKSI